MYTFTCKVCGKPMKVRYRKDIRQFCSDDCNEVFFHSQKEYEVNDESTNRHYVNPKGFDNLVSAMCQQARHDYLTNPPGNHMRVDAERFFRSDYFEALTELDGEHIVKRLEEEYKRKKRTRRRSANGVWQ